MIDGSEKFARKAIRRLSREKVGWFITVGSDGKSQPQPVWFLLDSGSILVYSKPGTRKVHHITRIPAELVNPQPPLEQGGLEKTMR